jgi:hypothetical protein
LGGRQIAIEGKVIKKKRKRKCIKPKKEQVKMVLTRDVGMEAVKGIMEKALKGSFMGKQIRGENLKRLAEG